MTQGPLQPAVTAGPFFGPGDPPPFEILNRDASRPLVIVCDHAGCRVPARLRGGLGVSEAVLSEHVAWDIGAAQVTRHLAERLGAVAVLSTYSRLIIDCNRQPGDPSAIPEVTCGVPVPGNVGLDEAERERRQNALFWPYQQAIGDTVARLWRRGLPPALIGLHSFTPVLGGRVRPWHIGVLWNRDPRLALPVLSRCASLTDLCVGDNEPYSGREIGFTMEIHAGAAGLPHVTFEIRQDLIATAAGAVAWADRIAGLLEGLIDDDSLHRVEVY